MSVQGQHPTRRYAIPPAQELRFELENPTDALSLKVISGYAELFGIELVTGATYGFSHEQRGGVWVPGINGEGAEIEMSPPTPLSARRAKGPTLASAADETRTRLKSALECQRHEPTLGEDGPCCLAEPLECSHSFLRSRGSGLHFPHSQHSKGNPPRA